jgi:hypothetical protein
MSYHKLTCLLVGAALALSTAVRSQPALAEEPAHKIITADQRRMPLNGKQARRVYRLAPRQPCFTATLQRTASSRCG